MEKRYCAHCKTLYDEETTICVVCGKSEFRVIEINVHRQSEDSSKLFHLDKGIERDKKFFDMI